MCSLCWPCSRGVPVRALVLAHGRTLVLLPVGNRVDPILVLFAGVFPRVRRCMGELLCLAKRAVRRDGFTEKHHEDSPGASGELAKDPPNPEQSGANPGQTSL